MTTPRETVLSTPELLELILLHLPQQTLLLAQRVNHTFHSLITSSPPLQRLLFFQPQPPACSNHPTTWQQNPLLSVSFLPFFQIQPPDRPRLWKAMGPEAFSNLDWTVSDAKRAAYARRDASWRKMLVVQPPVTVLNVERYSHASGGDSERVGRLIVQSAHDRDPGAAISSSGMENGPHGLKLVARPARGDLNGEGLTMGVLYDLMEQAVLGEEDSFWLEWHMFPPGDASETRAGRDWENSGEPAKYVAAAAVEGVEGGFVPRAEITLFLWMTIYCEARPGERSRLESEAAETVHVSFTE